MKRAYYESHLDEVYQIIDEGTKKASEDANVTLNEVKKAIGINYFGDSEFYSEIIQKYKQG